MSWSLERIGQRVTSCLRWMSAGLRTVQRLRPAARTMRTQSECGRTRPSLEIEVPRDRDWTFDPELVRKGQKQRKAVARDLRTIYRAASLEAAEP